jgi:steroid delta-isomerase-like uncharacterized protein
MPETKELIRKVFDDIINAGRMDVIDELFADDFVDHGPMGEISGRDNFRQLVEQWRAAVPDVRSEVANLVADGDLVGWTVRTTGTHTGDGLGFPATGKHFETLSANLGRVRDGRVAEHWSEQGMFPMLVQLGLIPMPAMAHS